MEEVQSYFEKRVEKIVESKGKKVIGWDEILEGGLAPNAAVMSWRGVAGGIAAAKLKHSVVMSPTTFVYLDYMQGDAAIEPPVYATLRLNTVYSYEPVPDSVDPKYIIGGQANLWTEQVYNVRHRQYMVWPRSLAVAEDFWSPKEKKDWNRFARTSGRPSSTAWMSSRSNMPVRCSTPSSRRRRTSTLMTRSPSTCRTEVAGLDIYYSFDNSNPDNFYPKYTFHPFYSQRSRLAKGHHLPGWQADRSADQCPDRRSATAGRAGRYKGKDRGLTRWTSWDKPSPIISIRSAPASFGCIFNPPPAWPGNSHAKKCR